MNLEDISISGLYYKYGKRDNEFINSILDRVKIVILKHIGINSEYNYYPLSEESISKIRKKPRNVSLTFDAKETVNTPLNNLIKYKTVYYLVKNNSPFFMKPDIGEILDQIDYWDLKDNKLKAIEFITGEYQLLPDTNDEHYILKANLLKEI